MGRPVILKVWIHYFVGDTSGNNRWSAHINQNSGTIGISSTSYNTVNAGPFSANTWYHVALVFSGSNIAIYVNGVDKTSQTNVNNFLVVGEPHHIVLVFASAITGAFRFNYESSGGPDNLYNNIALYTRALSEADVDNHFDLYCGRPYT